MSTINPKPDSPNQITISEDKKQITINSPDTHKKLNITTGDTVNVVTAASIGPQGPVGPEGQIGGTGGNTSIQTLNITSSGAISASGELAGSSLDINGSGNISSTLTVGGNLDISDTIYHTGDSNTKIRFPAVDTIAFNTSGDEQLRIDSAGNITASGNISSSGTGTNYFSGDVKIGNGADILLDEDQRIYFEADKNSYIESDSTDRVRLVTGGSVMMVWDEDDNRVVFGNGNKVFIGANNNAQPSNELEVDGNISASGNLDIDGNISATKITASGDVFVSQYIKHLGDVNTRINFTDDRIQFEAGGIALIGAHQKSSAPHQVTINNGGNQVDFVVKDNDNEFLLKTFSQTAQRQVKLYQNGNEKLATEKGGINVTGHLTASGNISSSGQLYGNILNARTRVKAIGSSLEFAGNSLDFVDGGSTSYLMRASASNAVSLYYSGNKKLETTAGGTNVTGNITASGDISASGDVVGVSGSFDYITTEEYIAHKGDVNTAIRFTDNKISLDAGGMTFFAVHDDDSAPFTATINGGSNRINFKAMDRNNDLLLKTDSEAFNVGLYYAGNEKLSTQAGGINVTGQISASGAITASSLHTIGNISASLLNLANVTPYVKLKEIDTGAESQVGIGSGKLLIQNNYDNAAGDIELKTEDFNDAIYIDNSAVSVGIGTSSPTAKLHVAGTLKVDGNAEFLGAVTSSIISSSVIYSSGSNIFGDAITDTHTFNGHITGSGDIIVGGKLKSSLSGQAILSLDNTATNGDEWNIISRVRGTTSTLEFRNVDTTNDAVAITSDGKVGIGVTAPGEELVVQKNDDVYVEIKATGSNSDSGIKIQNDAQQWRIYNWGGSSDRLNFRAETAGISVLTMTTDGKVGINNYTPSTRLDVSGSEEYLARFKSSDNKAYISVQDDDTMAYISAENANLSLGGNTGVNANNLNINTASGHVGIGVASPDSNLYVLGDTGIRVRKSSTSANNSAGIRFGVDTSDRIKSAIQHVRRSTNGTGDLQFWVDTAVDTNDVASSDVKMTISGSGEVGIGTTSPYSNLDVQFYSDSDDLTSGWGEASKNGMMIENTRNAAGRFANLDFRVNTADARIALEYDNANDGGLHFMTDNDNNPGTRMYIASAGNVGIGTTSPGGTLHISSSTDPNLIIENNDGSSILRFRRTDNNKNFDISMEGDDLRFTPTDNDGTQNILIGVNAGSNKIDSRLGVGTATPREMLDVSGSIIVEGDISASGLLYASGAFFGDQSDPSQIYDRGKDLFISSSDDLYLKQDDINIQTHGGGNWVTFNGGDGRVGIGTSTPAKRLTVEGDISASGALYIKSATYTSSIILDYDTTATNGVTIQGAEKGGGWARAYNFSTGSIKRWGGFGGYGGKGTFTHWYIGGEYNNNVMTLKSGSGRVGIGTSSPESLLHLHQTGSDQYQLILESTGSGGTGIKLSDTTTHTTNAFFYAKNNSAYLGTTDNEPINFQTNNTTRMTIVDSTGNVGIGTNNPTRQLHLHTGSTGNVYFKMSNTTSGTTAGSDGFDFLYTGLNMSFINRENGAITFETNGTERARILNDGKVGIGTTSPDSKLHISGGALHISHSGTGEFIKLSRQGSSINDYDFRMLDGGLTIYNATDTRKEMSFDGTGNVGIGDSSPDAKLSVEGAISSSGARYHQKHTFANDDATPSVADGTYFETGTNTDTITTFDGGKTGQIIYVISRAAITYDVTSTTLKGGTTDLVTADGDLTSWLYDGTNWVLISFTDQSDDLS